MYLLTLCFRYLNLNGITVDQATDHLEMRLAVKKKTMNTLRKGLRGSALAVSEMPWSTMRGTGKKRSRRKTNRKYTLF